MKYWMVIITFVLFQTSDCIDTVKYNDKDACDKPLGMHNGLIKDDQIYGKNLSNKFIVRKGSWYCWNGNQLIIDLQKEMKVTGISIYLKYAMDGIVLKYYKESTWWNTIINGAHHIKKYNITKAESHDDVLWFRDDFITAKKIKILFPRLAHCIRIELFGCPEICNSVFFSSSIQSSTLPTTNWNLSELEQHTIQLKYPVTISGVILYNVNKKTKITCELKKNIIKTQVVDIISHYIKRIDIPIATWFKDQQICDKVTIDSCKIASLVGCNSSCTKKFDVQTATLQQSDKNIQGNGNETQDVSQSYLNNPRASWQQDIALNTTHPWIQVCYASSIIVSGLALQGQGRWNSGLINKYTIRYTNKDNGIYQNYNNTDGHLVKFDSGIASRYGTYTNIFKEPFQAKCINLTALACAALNVGGCALRWAILGCHHEYVDGPEINITGITSTAVNFGWTFQTIFTEFIAAGYDVSLKNIINNQIVGHKVVQSSPLSFKVLNPYTNHTIEIKAFNRFGVFTKKTTKLFTTKEGLPSPPVNLKVFNESKDVLKITWETPQHLNGMLKHYEILVNGTKSYNSAFAFFRRLESIVTRTSINTSPGTNYSISVRAWTVARAGNSSNIVHKTSYGSPQQGNITWSSNRLSREQILIHTIPQMTGPIKYYELTISQVEEPVDCKILSRIELINVTFPPTETKMEINIMKGEEYIQFQHSYFQLNLVGSYSFSIRAVVSVYNKSSVVKNLYGNASTVCIERRDLKRPTWIKQTEPSMLSIYIPIAPNKTKFFLVIVSALNLTEEPKPSELRAFNESNPLIPYITMTFRANNYNDTFNIGDGKVYHLSSPRGKRSSESSNSYRNVPLKDGTSYFVLIRAHENQTTYYSTPLIHLQTPKDKVTTTTTPPTPTTTPTTTISTFNLIIIASAAAILMLVVIAISVIIFRRRRRNNSRKLRSSLLISKSNELTLGMENVTLDEYSDAFPEVNRNKEQVMDTSMTSMTDENIECETIDSIKPSETISIDPDHQPIKLLDLHSHWEKLRTDGFDEAKKEYGKIKSGQLYDWSEASSSKLKPKNRYANILTYNHSRVKLQEGSDYINASFIHGYSEPNMYIATQGPSKATENDFWQMVWEQNVTVVVMVTNVIENGKRKCEEYWPNDGAINLGNIEVKFAKIERYADFIVRTFEICKQPGKERRTVHQYHYLSWPDHGVPETPSNLLTFRQKMRKDHPIDSQQTPIVVHCSAGIGRSGTFICIDNMIKLADEKEIVDVFNYVAFMRSRRINMVQTVGQYQLIYHALIDVYICGSTEISASTFFEESRKLQTYDGKTSYKKQFELLNQVTLQLSKEETKVALQEDNKPKNRRSILPRDTDRVFLIDDGTYANNSNYINAVFVNGYKQKNAFIATEHPQENTASDFWRMVVGHKVKTIVKFNEDSKFNTVEFVPQVNAVSIHNDVTVKTVNEELKGKVSLKSISITNKKRKDQDWEVKMISLSEWIEDEAPKQTYDLLNILTYVEDNQKQHIAPVIVMCRNGAGCTGTYIGISIILEQLKMEQVVDVFQAIKKIRIMRPEFVANVKQYEFCYKLIGAYLDSFNTYSNFTA